MAAEVLGAAGHAVTVYDRVPSVARKLLIAGRGGLNLMHSQPFRPLSHAVWRGSRLPILDAFPSQG